MATTLSRGLGFLSTDSWCSEECACKLPAGNGMAEHAIHSASPDGLHYVARQPILDAHGHVHAYELLFRSGPAATQFSGDGDAATRAVLDDMVVFGLDRLTGGLPAFVNCTQEALLKRLVMVLPAKHTVLELLETLEPTQDLLQACVELKAHGFRLALDDFVWKPAWQPLLELADYVKLDLSTTTAEQRARIIGRVRGRSTQLIVERVETVADAELARREGFKLMQGYYFCRPVMMENQGIPSNHLVHLELLKALQEEPLDIRRISQLVKRDASLTYRLLRMANSPLYATSKTVSSIQGALIMIGDAMFRRVAMLAIASELRGDRPSELPRMAFLRGRFCELAAATTGQNPTEQYLLGILSLLPAMLRVPMERVAEALPLRAEMHDALLGESNPVRTVLDWLLYYELGRWECCDKWARMKDIKDESLPRIYAEALLWAESNMRLAG